MIFRLLLILFLTPVYSLAASYYVDPVNGLDSNDGSSSSPWKSLQKLIDNGTIESREWNSLPYSSSSYLIPKNIGAPIKGGDTIYLRSGKYDELSIISYYNTSPITIAAEPGENPIFRNIILRSSSNWIISGLTINPSSYASSSLSYMVSIENHNWTGPVRDLRIERCSLFSASSVSGWSKETWNTRAINGIKVDGTRMTIANNSLRNVNFGISVSATHSLIERNTIENFAGDGLRGLGDYTVFQYNTVKNCYDVNDNHDDGFQSWSVGSDHKVGTGVVTGIVLRGNTFINYEDPNQPFRGTLQGIGCFDGMFKDWLVERNIVKVDHWHGISLYGAIDSVIRDNVVMDLNSDRPGPPWIMLHKHKNGTPSRNSLITCNIAPNIIDDEGIHITVTNNVLSLTGFPRPQHCPAFVNLAPYLPLLLEADK